MTTLQIVLLFLFIFLLLIISILAIILFIGYLKFMRVSKVDKKEYYEELNNEIDKDSIVFLGDSLTEFYRLEEFFRGYNIYNRGIAGDTTDGVLDRLQTNVIKMDPSKVFLQIGTNDLNEKKMEKENIITNIELILTTLRDNLPKTKLYLISLYPVNLKVLLCSPMLVGKRRNSTIKEINDELKEFAKNNDIPFIDIYPHLLDEDENLKKEYTVEGLHISLEGYKVITNILKQYV